MSKNSVPSKVSSSVSANPALKTQQSLPVLSAPTQSLPKGGRPALPGSKKAGAPSLASGASSASSSHLAALASGAPGHASSYGSSGPVLGAAPNARIYSQPILDQNRPSLPGSRNLQPAESTSGTSGQDAHLFVRSGSGQDFVDDHNKRTNQNTTDSSFGDSILHQSRESKLKLPSGPSPVVSPHSKLNLVPPAALPGSAALHRPAAPSPAVEVPSLPSPTHSERDTGSAAAPSTPGNESSQFLPQVSLGATGSLQIVFQGRGYTEFPKRILETPGFTAINGGGNCLTSLPIGLAKCVALTRLEFPDNQFKEIPLVVTELPNLQYLDFSKNKISLLSPSICNIPTLKALLLASNRLKNFPNHICQILQLEHLDLSGNRVKSIPSQIGDLTSLKHLHLSNCELTSLPTEFEKLKNLDTLILDHNNISRLPGGSASMTSLRTLDLSYNSLLSTPANLFFLSALTELNLERNDLGDICEEVWRLSGLKTLNLEFNKLISLPYEMCTLSELTSLKLTGNTLSSIPSEFHSETTLIMNYLARLKMQSAWRRRKLVIVGEENVGKTSLRMQLTNSFATKQSRKKRKHRGHELQTAGSQSQITGTGSSGALAEMADPVATDGIDIEDWEPLGTDEDGLEPIVFNTWDFAGQNIYHPTHQFFITNRSIYLIIFNLLDERTARVEYWLKTLRVRTDGRCPVVVVGTHMDDRKCDSKYVEAIFKSMKRRYSNRFPFVREYVAVSSKTGKGLSKLTETLVSLARSNASFQQIPESYSKLEKSILQIRTTANTLSFTDFVGVAIQAGVDKSAVPSCLQFLHDVGLVMHFDDKTAGLRDLVILDPLWIANLLSSIITLKHSYGKDGIIMASSLPLIWKEYPQSEFKWMLNLLDKFEITFRISAAMTQGTRNAWIRVLLEDQKISLPSAGEEKSRTTNSSANSSPNNPIRDSKRSESSVDSKSFLDDMIVIPSLLPVQPDDLHFSELWTDSNLFTGSVTGRRYIFQFLPLGFFSRLLVRVLHLSGVNPQYLWRDGMIVDSDSERAILLHNELDFQLDVVVKKKRKSDAPDAQQGDQLTPRRQTVSMSAVNLLRQLSDCIETLLVSWFKLKVIVKVPCHHCLNEKMLDPDVRPYYFPIEECMLAVREGQNSVECLADTLEPRVKTGTSKRHKRRSQSGRTRTTAEAIFATTQSSTIASGNGEAPAGNNAQNSGPNTPEAGSPQIGTKSSNNQKDTTRSPSNIQAPISAPSETAPPSARAPNLADIAKSTTQAGSTFGFSSTIGSSMWNASSMGLQVPSHGAQPKQRHICSLQDLCPDIAFMDLRDLTITFDDLKVGKVIGEGSYAELRTGTYNGETVAVKVLKHQTTDGGHAQQMDLLSDSFRELQHETFVMKNLQNPYLVALKGICTHPLAMVMDYFPLGSLDRHLRDPKVKHPALSWKYRVRLGLNIARGMDYLHSEDFIHRDLRSPNILIASRDENEEIVAKVADFGLAVICAKEIKGGDFNECWTAPEILAASAYNSKVDQYSFGIVMWELLELGHPFKEYEEVYAKLPRLDFFEAIINGLRPSFPKDCPEDYQKLVNSCWATEPLDRPTFARIADILVDMEPIAAQWDAGKLDATMSTNPKNMHQSVTLRNLLKKKSKENNLASRVLGGSSSPVLALKK